MTVHIDAITMTMLVVFLIGFGAALYCHGRLEGMRWTKVLYKPLMDKDKTKEEGE